MESTRPARSTPDSGASAPICGCAAQEMPAAHGNRRFGVVRFRTCDRLRMVFPGDDLGRPSGAAIFCAPKKWRTGRPSIRRCLQCASTLCLGVVHPAARSGSCDRTSRECPSITTTAGGRVLLLSRRGPHPLPLPLSIAVARLIALARRLPPYASGVRARPQRQSGQQLHELTWQPRAAR